MTGMLLDPPAAAEWSVRTDHDARATVVSLRGEVDVEVAQPLHRCLCGGLEHGADIVVDLAGVSVLDGTCLGVLVRVGHRAGELGRTVALAGPPPLIRRTLAITRVDAALPVFPDPDQALRWLRPADGSPRSPQSSRSA